MNFRRAGNRTGGEKDAIHYAQMSMAFARESQRKGNLLLQVGNNVNPIFMNFKFFKGLLTENRSYDYTAGHIELVQRETARMRQAYPETVFPTFFDGPVGNWDCPSTTVSHLVAPKGEGVGSIEEQFFIHLPTDFKEFYHLHNEALILTRNPVLIMTPEQLISVSDELREAHEVPKDLPRHIIRFGWLGTDSYFLLRYCEEASDWKVMISSYSHATDAELQDRTAWGTPSDKSFTDWLHRMIETDGAPLHPAHADEEDDFFVKRVA